jgi:maltooligosyltrehalose synthase
MAKGYRIAHVDVADPEAYKARLQRVSQVDLVIVEGYEGLQPA